jgi:hypothetical protein
MLFLQFCGVTILSSLFFASNLVFHARTKYIEFNYHFVREKVTDGSIRVHFIFSQDQVVDALIKPLSSNHFIDLKFKLTAIIVSIALERAYQRYY